MRSVGLTAAGSYALAPRPPLAPSGASCASFGSSMACGERQPPARQRPELHAPKVQPVLNADDCRQLKKAARLTAVANAVTGMDLKGIATAYQRENGCSALEAAAVAADTLNAALRASLAGPAGAEAAEAALKKAAKKKALEARSEAHRAQCAAAEGPVAEEAREQVRVNIAQRSERAAAAKDERIAESAAVRKAQREERQFEVQARRALSEARARFGTKGPPSYDEFREEREVQPTADPVLKRAQSLCNGARRVIAQLDDQNEMLKRQVASRSGATPVPPLSAPALAAAPSGAAASSRPSPSRGAGRATKVVGTTKEDERLIARARELLVDYNPAEQRRRPNVPSARPSPRALARAVEGNPVLAKAKQLNASVSLELSRRR
eukprot:TRINITY_DN33336_c0_g1_i1.p1 TRINITY_DN33336_c0_g1~~TRINITY_DN33336_c0_g1_i1.p1  ORF type:complete len:408 (-),score=107.47 TRINITY_DN33336_c0_g1_i1:69-1214(-)